MSKKIQLTIPTPCHENWNNMLPADKGRFCLSCSKEVVDFTAMSDSQLIAFFKKPSMGSVCGRFMDDQLNRQIIEPRKKLPWIKYFFQFAIPAFLISSKACAQETKGKVAAVCSNEVKGDTIAFVSATKPIGNKQIKGIIKDKDGNPIIGCSVYIKDTRTGTVADATGNFTLAVDSSKSSIILVFSSVGFLSQEKKIEIATYKMEDIIMTQLDYALSGEVVIIAGMVAPEKKKSVPLIEKIFRDTVFNKFSVYPNPALAGSYVTIKSKKLKAGDYKIELQNQSGQLVNTESVQMAESQKSMQLKIPQVTPGIYFIKISGEKLKSIYTEKIIVN